MDFWDRIKIIADSEDISITRLEQKIGASQGVLSKQMRIKGDISMKWIIAIEEKFPRYSIEWVLTGKGNMEKTKAEEVKSTEDRTIQMLFDRNERLIRDNERLNMEIESLRAELGQKNTSPTSR